jgi:DNA-binding LacI/PurR family transcriptional regulator
VTQSTVSRVINNSPAISADTRAEVLRAIDALGYRPVLAGRALARQCHEVVGLVGQTSTSGTYYGQLLMQGVTIALGSHGYGLAVGMLRFGDPAELIGELPFVRGQAVDGLIVDLIPGSGDVETVVGAAGLPAVYVNPVNARPCNAVMLDDEESAATITGYLLDRGHRAIGYVPSDRRNVHASDSLRKSGFVRAMLAAGVQPLPHWDEPFEERHHDIASLAPWVAGRLQGYRAHGCTAVVAYDYKMCAAVLRACHSMDLRVPEDLSIVVCDHAPPLAEMPVPVTGMFTDRVEIGRAAVGMLLQRVEAGGEDQPSEVVAAALVEGASVAPREQPADY